MRGLRVGCLAATAAILLTSPVFSQDRFAEVEYVSGKAGFAKKVKGFLTLDQKAVSFSDRKGETLFSIPMAEIDKAAAGTEHEEGSFGRKMALGIFASKTQEYLNVESHNGSGAEGVVFKVKKKAGPGMATKINFWALLAKASAPEPANEPAVPAEPPPRPERPAGAP
jgi:hypothetical protein